MIMGTKCTTYSNSYEYIKCSKPVSTTCQAEFCDNRKSINIVLKNIPLPIVTKYIATAV